MKKKKVNYEQRIGMIKRFTNVTILLAVISLFITALYIVFSNTYQDMIVIMLGVSGGFLLATLIGNFYRSILIANKEKEEYNRKGRN